MTENQHCWKYSSSVFILGKNRFPVHSNRKSHCIGLDWMYWSRHSTRLPTHKHILVVQKTHKLVYCTLLNKFKACQQAHNVAKYLQYNSRLAITDIVITQLQTKQQQLCITVMWHTLVLSTWNSSREHGFSLIWP